MTQPLPINMHPNDTVKCFSSHMGFWMVESTRFTNIVQAIVSGVAKEKPMAEVQAASSSKESAIEGVTVKSGIAFLQLEGVMQKGFSKYGGASTIELRKQIRAAVESKDVEQILLSVDTPGGSVSGNNELAQEIEKAASIKPFIVQVEDLNASAGVWATAHATAIYSNATAEIGSIGTMAMVHDTSEAYKREGVKVHMISTGDMKGAFADGTPITDAMLENLQSKINSYNEFFLSAVSKGRDIEMSALKKIATGETFLASEALELGLIDGIQTPEQTVSNMLDEISAARHTKRVNKATGLTNNRRAQSRVDILRSQL